MFDDIKGLSFRCLKMLEVLYSSINMIWKVSIVVIMYFYHTRAII